MTHHHRIKKFNIDKEFIRKELMDPKTLKDVIGLSGRILI